MRNWPGFLVFNGSRYNVCNISSVNILSNYLMKYFPMARQIPRDKNRQSEYRLL